MAEVLLKFPCLAFSKWVRYFIVYDITLTTLAYVPIDKKRVQGSCTVDSLMDNWENGMPK